MRESARANGTARSTVKKKKIKNKKIKKNYVAVRLLMSMGSVFVGGIFFSSSSSHLSIIFGAFALRRRAGVKGKRGMRVFSLKKGKKKKSLKRTLWTSSTVPLSLPLPILLHKWRSLAQACGGVRNVAGHVQWRHQAVVMVVMMKGL